jgi:hypothetical protein
MNLVYAHEELSNRQLEIAPFLLDDVWEVPAQHIVWLAPCLRMASGRPWRKASSFHASSPPPGTALMVYLSPGRQP